MKQLFYDLREVWQYRALLYMLVMRDLKARYRGSILGIAWSYFQPLGMMLALTFAFSVISSGPPTIERYSIFVLSGLLVWNFFSASVTGSAGSVLANAGLVKKVYFPRLVLPISVVAANLVNFLFAMLMWLTIALIVGHPIHYTVLLLPMAIVLQFIFSTGMAFLLSTLNVFYRDTQFILDLALLALFFLTPIWYDIDSVPQREVGLWLRRLNPVASLVNIYQDLMYWGRLTDWDFILRTLATALAILIVGYLVFQRYSPRFGEEL
jgi:ABC-type polysaccharide/polyol phosphate export permease